MFTARFSRRRSSLGRFLFSALLAAALSSESIALPGANAPLPMPDFSIDRVSPTVSPVIHADDILGKPGPTVVYPNVGMNLGRFGDELDDFSGNRNDVLPGDSFALLFGVDRTTVGSVPPDPGLVGLGFPFNVKDQAAHNQAPGDVFMSTQLFDRAGPVSPFARALKNNVLVINQGDTGGVDSDLMPDISPLDMYPAAGPKDNNDGLAYFPPTRLISPAWFSLSNPSPSLAFLPTAPPSFVNTGVDIFFDPNPTIPGGEQHYATGFDLGLQHGDDIDALIVFDDGDGLFNPLADQMVFSLRTGSPTLGLGFSAADILTTVNGSGFALYAAASELGLLPSDELDCLELLLTNNIDAAIHDHAIYPEPASLLLLLAGLTLRRHGVRPRREPG